MKSLPDTATPNDSLSLLKCWQMCQSLVKHFWKCWSAEYINHIGRFTKWKEPTRNMQVGDLVIVRKDSPVVTKWPLARIVKVHPGKDKLVRVADQGWSLYETDYETCINCYYHLKKQNYYERTLYTHGYKTINFGLGRRHVYVC